MPFLLVLATFVGLLLTTLSLLSLTEIWQRKEYRFDRMQDYLASPAWLTERGYWYLSALLITNFAWANSVTLSWYAAEIVGWFALAIVTLAYLNRSHFRGIYRPKFTFKALLILTLTALQAYLYLMFSFSSIGLIALQWTTLLVLLPFLTTISVFLINFATQPVKSSAIRKARQLRQSLPQLTVVGITGSYGKTSTKEFLATILKSAGKNFAVTHKRKNAPFPVARDMLQNLTSELDVYICEMGAYKAGEIKELTELAQPNVSVITAIGNQHLSLFGSPKKLLNTKWEIIDGLEKSGTAVLNADSPQLMHRAQALSHSLITFNTPTSDVFAANLNLQSTSFVVDVTIAGITKRLTIPLTGQALLTPALAAAATAHALGLTPSEIFSGLGQLANPERTLQTKSGIFGSVVIDDSYSANQAGFLAALDHLKTYPNSPQLILTTPLIELGTDSQQAHFKIGRALAMTGAKVFIFGYSYRAQILAGALKVNHDPDITFVKKPAEFSHQLDQLVNNETVTLLEGRIPNIVRSSLLS